MNSSNDYLDYLAHHGIRGQRWGIRRYQNPDGSYTAEGRKRYDKNINKNIDDAIRRTSTAFNSVDEASSTIKKMTKRAKAEKTKSKSMTNKELQEAINRKTLERTYNSLIESETAKGLDYVMDTMKVIKDVSTTAMSAIGAGYAIRGLFY